MSKKGKSRKRFSDYEVRLADGSYRLLFGARLRRMADGGHVFTDKKGIRASYGPGQVASADRMVLSVAGAFQAREDLGLPPLTEEAADPAVAQ